MLKLLAGELVEDSGRISRQPGLRVSLLSQEVESGFKGRVYDVVAGGLGDALRLISMHHDISERLMTGDHKPDLIQELEKVEEGLEAAGGWQTKQRIDSVLSRLQLDADQEFEELSGGLKRRVMLGRALASDPDLLLLDEPTNHLDIRSIAWLEEFLLNARCTILFITHDRFLLKKIATRILDLDRGTLRSWPGNYDKYLQRREEVLAVEAEQHAKFDKKLSREETWIRQGIKARRTRNQGRVRALLALREQRQARRQLSGKGKMEVQEAARSGRLVAQVKNISYRYGATPVVHDFSATILRGDKIGLIGPNGCGKTTLLSLLLGHLEPMTGSVRLGTNLQPAYFDQMRSQLDPEKSVGENVGEGKDTVVINNRSRHIVGYLRDFLFAPERIGSPVKTLSGGERNRLLLAKLFAQPANILVLDEPTNDLDIETLELLEELLLDYHGTVMLVSHDRAFINNVVTSTMVFEDDGNIREYAGGYDDWLRQRPVIEKKVEVRQAADKKKESPPCRKRRLTFKEKQQLEMLPHRIEELEAEQQKLYDKLADPAFYQQSGEETAGLKNRLAKLAEELETSYARWEELESVEK